MLQFPYVVLSERSFDSSTGQGEKASVELPIAVVHLQDNVDLDNRTYWENDKRFVLFISFNVW
jgi:hypothetical protein